MKNIIIYLAIIFTVLSCEKVEDDFDDVCTGNCTILQGNFVTANNVPLQNIKVELDYKASSTSLSISIRNIKKGKTDVNGLYNLSFYVKDNELGTIADGYFRFQADYTNLDSDEYIVSNQVTFAGYIEDITRRDTIVQKSFYIPKKAAIKVNLSNFQPIQVNDRVQVRSFYPSGPKVDQNDFLETGYSTGSHLVVAENVINQTIDLIVAKNETNIISIYKVKDGVETFEEFEIFIPENNTIELNHEY